MRYWAIYVLWQLSVMAYVWVSGRLVGIIR
jgi:hypothetical protein